jgi:sec-independent protein translocase protein TatC
MDSYEEQRGPSEPGGEGSPGAGDPGLVTTPDAAPAGAIASEATEATQAHVSDATLAVAQEPAAPAQTATGKSGGPTPPSPPDDEDDGDEGGMLRMSFMDHLEELRRRILWSLAGVGVAFVVCIAFANRLWLIISAPAVDSLRKIGADPTLAQITPMDAFVTVWVKAPMLTSLFLASPWVLFQVWSFIAPGLYKRERRWAGPFVICTAGLFILGGLFAYFVAFRFGLEFLLSIGRDINVKPVVSLTEYFDLFVNVTLGIGLVFELPVLLFFLTLLRIVSPRFLIRNTRYAILLIVVLAALITPTPDIFNLMLFTVPMVLLYFVGVFASYLLVLHRENRRFPWGKIMMVLGPLVLLAALGIWLAMARYGYHFELKWPFLTR